MRGNSNRIKRRQKVAIRGDFRRPHDSAVVLLRVSMGA